MDRSTLAVARDIVRRAKRRMSVTTTNQVLLRPRNNREALFCQNFQTDVPRDVSLGNTIFNHPIASRPLTDNELSVLFRRPMTEKMGKRRSFFFFLFLSFPSSGRRGFFDNEGFVHEASLLITMTSNRINNADAGPGQGGRRR